jgi:hypothetical protein
MEWVKMSFSNRELWTLIHGMIFGALFLLSFGGGLAGLWSLRPELVTQAGIIDRVRRLKIGMVAMAVAAWGTVLTGTWVVYPWYRAKLPTSAKSILLSNPNTADWHNFGMEWKEHIAWLSPILATLAAFIVVVMGVRLVQERKIVKAVMIIFVLAFSIAAVAGLFGALITKAAPVH